ncbi:hypothetical protein Y032_0001g390 [Ancylostoma ceylanicum]|uniref:SH3 domain-containing protein n=1 Tax=Ancylostoma ceylanicum TaxID=53326 RepID=A0A016W417_9BILA|nr:hypothetical protein Y032_0001g390 [Ancylostoma ceylanicum]
MSASQGDIMVGNVKSLVDRLSKDFSASRPPLSIHESRKPMVPKPNPHLQHVITTFAYSAAQDDELTLELGDIIEVLEEVEDGWSRGRQLRTGLVGMFPTNFVKPDVPSTATSVREEDKVVIRHTNDADLPEANRRTPSIIGGSSALGSKISHVETKDEPRTKEMARVKFEYEPQHSDELRLGEIGQLITIIRKDCGDAGWFEGEINGRRGLFPDNFVELVQVPISTQSGTLYHPPTAHHPKVIAKAPAVNPAGIIPPAVPAKPLKQKLSESSTSINGAGASPPSSNAAASPSPVLPSQVRQHNSAFAAARDRISKDLIVGQPGQVSSKLTKSVIVSSGQESIATARPVSTIEAEEASDDVARPLSHVTKTRVRPPGKRPVSMLLIKKKGSLDNLLESPTQPASSDLVEKNTFSAAIAPTVPASTSPTSHSANFSQKVSSSTTSSAKVVPVRPPPAEMKKDEKRDQGPGELSHPFPDFWFIFGFPVILSFLKIWPRKVSYIYESSSVLII